MNPNLEVLREEIPEAAKRLDMVVFRGSRHHDDRPVVEWDTHRDEGYQGFLETAGALGVKLVVFRDQEFKEFMVEGALEDLEDSEMAYDERRHYEQQLKEFRPYSGFTCSIDLSFSFEGTLYVFELRTEWYREFQTVAEEVATLAGEEADDSPLGGYYSNN